MNLGKPLCKIDKCMQNAEDGYEFCLEHNPKYIEGRNDQKQDLIKKIREMKDKVPLLDTQIKKIKQLLLK